MTRQAIAIRAIETAAIDFLPLPSISHPTNGRTRSWLNPIMPTTLLTSVAVPPMAWTCSGSVGCRMDRLSATSKVPDATRRKLGLRIRSSMYSRAAEIM